jgi:hypothetical protein
MVRMQGRPPQNNGGWSDSDFYDASKTNVSYPIFHAPKPKGGGYATPELEAAARPYKDIGKANVNLFPGAPQGQPPPGAPRQPGAAEIMQGMNLPVKFNPETMAVLGGGIDLLSNLTGALGNMQQATPKATEAFDRLRDTPDEQLQDWERQVKGLNEGIFALPPDSPMMQGKQVAEVYKAYQLAEAHAKGSSAMLTQEPGSMGPLDMNPLGGIVSGALNTYGQLTNFLKRGEGSLPFNDQLQQLKRDDATPELLGEERWAIREQLKSGELNEEEARDAIAMSGMALSNPNPLGTKGPVQVIANAALALGGEIVGDPLTAPAVVATGGAYLGKAPVQATLMSIIRAAGKAEVEAGIKATGKVLGESAMEEALDAARQSVIRQASELATERVGRQAGLRHLPKEATALAKQTGKVAEGHVSDFDRLEALLEMGADPAHPLAEGIKAGKQAAGTMGHIAVEFPKIVRMGQAIDKMVDPLSLFGYWKTGRVVPAALSKHAAQGYLDALGWRVTHRLDAALRDAGVDMTLADGARQVAGANHVAQAGNRANVARQVSQNSAIIGPETPAQAGLRHASRRDGDIRRLTRNQVDRTLEFIVPATRGGKDEAVARCGSPCGQAQARLRPEGHRAGHLHGTTATPGPDRQGAPRQHQGR